MSYDWLLYKAVFSSLNINNQKLKKPVKMSDELSGITSF
ncbi:hypothetical protein ykris0001_35460 [Yersinia kristensenii ATCC 33638]|nr:hypothetical protein ykris0001_21870 [Yersinia kristensenii ATCC 33638]EEP93415.1 hypothetical protein ykris0001_35460 [Yersinia kristensenii ATCC 33638]